MPRGRGGARQGTPGKGYTNRTDLTSDYNQSQNTAASGGMTPPAEPQPVTSGPLPDEIPSISTPTMFPSEPITAGLNVGPGPGPNRDNRAAETRDLQRYLPLIGLYLDSPETPDSVKALYRYIRGA